MGQAYHIKDPQSTHYLTFQIIHWIDIFTRQRYRDIVVQSFNYCIQHKGLQVYAWVIMSNHIHCILQSTTGKLADTIRDLKSHTSKQIIKSIQEEPESRKEWMLVQFKQSGISKGQQFQLWTHENHAIDIPPQYTNMLHTKINYIHNNTQQSSTGRHRTKTRRIPIQQCQPILHGQAKPHNNRSNTTTILNNTTTQPTINSPTLQSSISNQSPKPRAIRHSTTNHFTRAITT
jgi:REP element-mobilizing transposase RayT